MIIIDFFYFLFSKENKKRTVKHRDIFWNIIIILIVLKLFTFIYITVLNSIFELPLPKTKIDNPNLNILITGGILLAPIIEELTCRLALRYTARNLSISLGLLLSFTLILAFNIKLMSFLAFFLIFSLPSVVYIILDYNKKMLDPILQKIWNEHFYKLFYFSAIIFSLPHISNYKIENFQQSLLIPVILFIYFLVGLILGYIRIKFGIFWSWLTHILNNLLGVFIIFFN